MIRRVALLSIILLLVVVTLPTVHAETEIVITVAGILRTPNDVSYTIYVDVEASESGRALAEEGKLLIYAGQVIDRTVNYTLIQETRINTARGATPINLKMFHGGVTAKWSIRAVVEINGVQEDDTAEVLVVFRPIPYSAFFTFDGSGWFLTSPSNETFTVIARVLFEGVLIDERTDNNVTHMLNLSFDPKNRRIDEVVIIVQDTHGYRNSANPDPDRPLEWNGLAYRYNFNWRTESPNITQLQLQGVLAAVLILVISLVGIVLLSVKGGRKTKTTYKEVPP